MNDDLEQPYDLLIVGAGPTGLAIAVAALEHGLKCRVLERGALTQNILDFPEFMNFFTTRDKLEIAGMPLCIPDEKPSRQQALLYYRAVAAKHRVPVAFHEEVLAATRANEMFTVITRTQSGGECRRTARAVALATGYFHNPLRLEVPGAEKEWVHTRYHEPYRHFGERVVLIGGGNSSCEAALDLWRNGAQRVTVLVRGAAVREGVKYWVRPDIENRIAEGSIDAHYHAQVAGFEENPRRVVAIQQGQRIEVPCDAVYALIGYRPDAELQRRCGVAVDAESLVPQHDPATCETNVPNLYVAGTLQAGKTTDRIFIENSRDHGERIVNHLIQKIRDW